MIPYVTENTGNGLMSSDVVTKLFNDRNILLCSPIETSSVTSVIAQLLVLDGMSNDPITIYINSPGGSISDGLALIDVINSLKSPVSIIGMGMVASMGAVILACGKKGSRFLLKNTLVLIHEGRITSMPGGTITDTTITVESLQKQNDKTAQLLSEATGKTIEEIKYDTARDKYMSAEQAVAYGLADRVI